MLSWLLHKFAKTQDSIMDDNWKCKLFFFQSFPVVEWDWLERGPLCQLRCLNVADVELLCWIKSGRDFFFFSCHRLINQYRRGPPTPTPSPSACNQIAAVLQVRDSWGQCLHFRLHQWDGWPESSSRGWGNITVTRWRVNGKHSALRDYRHDILFSELTGFV